MILLGEPAEGFLNILLRGVFRHAEQAVGIGVGHRVGSSSPMGARAQIN